MSFCACHSVVLYKVKNPEMPWTLSWPLGINSGHAQQHGPCVHDVHFIAHAEID